MNDDQRKQYLTNIGNRIRILRLNLGMSQDELAKKSGYSSRSTINKIELGINDIPQSKIKAISDALNTTPAYIMGWDEVDSQYVQPTISDDIVTYPVIGEVAAGYDHIAEEDWTGETVDIPKSYLAGREKSDYFVLTVCGDSMYPLYIPGDKVLVLRQPSLDRSGQVGVILYDGDKASLKKVEYVQGEDWLRMVPINPLYPPVTIKGVDLEQCRILGVPNLIIPDVKE